MTPALTRRDTKHAARREAVEASVLGATEALLNEGAPYSDLKVEEIAARAGISRPAFYFYFRDKRELLMRLTQGVSDALYVEAERWWGGSGNGAAALRQALGRVLGLYHDHAVLLRAVVEVGGYDDVIGDFWRRLAQRFVDRTRERIQQEQALGEAPQTPAAQTAFALVWMTERACYQQTLQGGELTEEAFTEAISRIWLQSVYADPV